MRGMRPVVEMFSLSGGILMALKKSRDSRVHRCSSINAARSRPHARPSQGRPTVACILRVLVLSVRIMQAIPSALSGEHKLGKGDTEPTTFSGCAAVTLQAVKLGLALRDPRARAGKLRRVQRRKKKDAKSCSFHNLYNASPTFLGIILQLLFYTPAGNTFLFTTLKT